MFFDFFGTLVDYDPSIHPAAGNAPWDFARRAGVQISEETSNSLWQQSWDDMDADAARSGREHSMHDIAQNYWRAIGSPALTDGAIDRLIDEYFQAWTQDVRIAPGARECVADLGTDHTLAIVSNTHDARLVPRLARRFGLYDAMDRVVTSVETGWRKPHPAIFDTALRVCGAAARTTVYVGDNWAADVEGPRALGMPAIYVGTPGDGRAAVPLEDVPAVIRSLD
ncbi:HAD family hydrolase [Mycobacterium sp. WMMD1722]|uniref:HAD family hydrolase n=1 Tax=Mycobacterium sp. WMMD1722 TaxID=3404117 RepID=UPI003BF52315